MTNKFDPILDEYRQDDFTSLAFTELSDVPSTFSGQGTKIVRVNAAATALEFVTAQSIEDVDWGELGGTLSDQTDLQTALDAKGTFTLPSLTSGSVAFSNGTTLAQDNASFFFDDTNNQLLLSSGVANTTSPFQSTNTTDNASVLAGIFQGDRATIADNDLAYLSLRLSDSAGNQDEQARIAWSATTVASGATQDGDLIFSSLVNNTL